MTCFFIAPVLYKMHHLLIGLLIASIVLLAPNVARETSRGCGYVIPKVIPTSGANINNNCLKPVSIRQAQIGHGQRIRGSSPDWSVERQVLEPTEIHSDAFVKGTTPSYDPPTIQTTPSAFVILLLCLSVPISNCLILDQLFNFLLPLFHLASQSLESLESSCQRSTKEKGRNETVGSDDEEL
jgi:hypothetical protein